MDFDPSKKWNEGYKEGRDYTTLNEVFVDEILIPQIETSISTRRLLDIGC